MVRFNRCMTSLVPHVPVYGFMPLNVRAGDTVSAAAGLAAAFFLFLPAVDGSMLYGINLKVLVLILRL